MACACNETSWEIGKGMMPAEEGYKDRAVMVLEQGSNP
jgi:hypothetical protein